MRVWNAIVLFCILVMVTVLTMLVWRFERAYTQPGWKKPKGRRPVRICILPGGSIMFELATRKRILIGPQYVVRVDLKPAQRDNVEHKPSPQESYRARYSKYLPHLVSALTMRPGLNKADLTWDLVKRCS